MSKKVTVTVRSLDEEGKTTSEIEASALSGLIAVLERRFHQVRVLPRKKKVVLEAWNRKS